MPRVVPSQVVTVIDTLFPFTAKQKETERIPLGQEYQGRLTAILDLVDEIPSELMNLAPEEYGDFLISRSMIRSKVNTWQTRGGTAPLEYIPSYRTKDLNPLTVLRRCLDLCPDEFPAPSTADLAFISDDELRRILRLDISAVTQALSSNEWKAATILAGSVVEALLLWALEEKMSQAQRNRAKNFLFKFGVFSKKPGALDKWTLHHFIEVAEYLDVIEKETADQARLTRNFRNLIHAGRAKRLGQECDRGTAMSAVAGLELVVRDLIKRYSAP